MKFNFVVSSSLIVVAAGLSACGAKTKVDALKDGLSTQQSAGVVRPPSQPTTGPVAILGVPAPPAPTGGGTAGTPPPKCALTLYRQNGTVAADSKAITDVYVGEKTIWSLTSPKVGLATKWTIYSGTETGLPTNLVGAMIDVPGPDGKPLTAPFNFPTDTFVDSDRGSYKYVIAEYDGATKLCETDPVQFRVKAATATPSPSPMPSSSPSPMPSGSPNITIMTVEPVKNDSTIVQVKIDGTNVAKADSGVVKCNGVELQNVTGFKDGVSVWLNFVPADVLDKPCTYQLSYTVGATTYPSNVFGPKTIAPPGSAGAGGAPKLVIDQASLKTVQVDARYYTVQFNAMNTNLWSGNAQIKCEKNDGRLPHSSSTASSVTLNMRAADIVNQKCTIALIMTGGAVSNVINLDANGVDPLLVRFTKIFSDASDYAAYVANDANVSKRRGTGDNPTLSWDEWNYYYGFESPAGTAALGGAESYFTLGDPSKRFTAQLPIEPWYTCWHDNTCVGGNANFASDYYK